MNKVIDEFLGLSDDDLVLIHAVVESYYDNQGELDLYRQIYDVGDEELKDIARRINESISSYLLLNRHELYRAIDRIMKK